MTNEEFAEWFTFLRGSFSRLETRLKDRAAGQAMARAWRESLRPVSLEDATAYVQRMLDGGAFVPEWPNEWDSFPAMVRAWAREEARRRAPTKPRPAKQRGWSLDERRDYRERLRAVFPSTAAKLDTRDPLPEATP